MTTIRQAPSHQAICGRGRSFMSAEMARQYEAGWCHWPDGIPDSMFGTPFSVGWFDREDLAEKRAEARIEQFEEQRDSGDR